MTDYPSNSHNKGKDKREDKKLEKVVEGKVTTRRKPFSKKLAETFTPIDVSEVIELVIFDQAIPGIKRLILDTLTEGGERMFFGDTRKRRNMVSSPAYTSYHKISSGGAIIRDQKPQLSRDARARHDFEQVVLESRADAEEILEKLGYCVEEYGTATVSDLYELLGLDEKWHTDNKWGWTDLSEARVQGIREGFLLDLPKPKPLD